jgi:GT2 family glycosyltransferase
MVHVVVPVFRNFALVQACLQSVIHSLPHNATPTQLTVVNDASPEPALVQWLEALQRTQQITLITNHHNLGFIETCNRAMRQCAQGHVLLLNADTLVNGDWVDRMTASLHQAPDIASVTPWSNNGEVTSFPAIGKAASPPNVEQLARINAIATSIRASGASADVEIPTACGFAMLMRRQAIDAIGLLDGVGLLRGYSEEVDWCLRATAAGYRHLAATAVFVAHAGKASFGYEKHLRVAQNRAVIAARYPHFYDQYNHFLRTDPLSQARQALTDGLHHEHMDWPPAAKAKGPLSASTALALPIPLPTKILRIAVWRPPVGSMAATKVLALARYLAAHPQAQGSVRILVIGVVTEPCLRTGVVDVIPPQTEPTETAIATDMALLGLCGCKVVLCADALEVFPKGIDVVPLSLGFAPRKWLDAWLASHNLHPADTDCPQSRAKRQRRPAPSPESYLA